MPELTGRLGKAPQLRCVKNATCPDVFTTRSGDYAVIGTNATAEQRADAVRLKGGIGADESMVVVPRQVLHDALPGIVLAWLREVLSNWMAVSARMALEGLRQFTVHLASLFAPSFGDAFPAV